ncbi:MAG: DNA polymerase III subunit delta [Planctomycetaceae bacterium]
MHATQFLSSPPNPIPPIIVMFGAEDHLKQQSLHLLQQILLGSDADAELSLSRYSGKEFDYATIRDELMTVSMFSSARIVLIDGADDFIKDYRAQLEDYFDRPSSRSTLVMIAKSWNKSTKLAKRLPKCGLEIDCGELPAGQLLQWLISQTQVLFEKQLSRDAAALMLQLAGTGMGLLTRELEKLAAYVGDRARIGVDDVRILVGGWKAETTWDMINAIRDGQPGVALSALDKLLNAGEAPQMILGGINFVFRKFAQATERARGGVTLSAALKQAQVFFRDIESSEQYLRRIGRQRAERLLTLLSQADAGLKGGSRISERIQLERLVLELSGSIPPKP